MKIVHIKSPPSSSHRVEGIARSMCRYFGVWITERVGFHLRVNAAHF